MKMTDALLKKELPRIFGKDVKWDRKGKFVFVHLDESKPEERVRRVDCFDPTMFFDINCTHCQPFLNDGAIMIYTNSEIVGMRLLDDGMFETVILNRYLKRKIAN